MKRVINIFFFLILLNMSIYSQNPPTYLTAIEGDEEVQLNWLPPGTTFTEGETCVLPLQGGTLVDGSSITITGSTVEFENDYQNGTVASGKDIVYQFDVVGNLDVTFSFCNVDETDPINGASWDTYLILFDDSSCETILASNDDFCGLQSELTGTLSEGSYYLVVDAYSGTAEGVFDLRVEASSSIREMGNFNENQMDSHKISQRELNGTTISAIDEYTAGVEQTIEFSLDVVSTDTEWVDGFSLAFPEDWIMVSGSNDQGEIVFAEDNLITFGNPDGGSQSGPWVDNQSHPFFITLIAPQTGGNVEVQYYVGGDEWGEPPHSAEGSFILAEYIPAPGDLLGYNVYLDNILHNSSIIIGNSYTVDGLNNGTQYSLGVSSVYFLNANSNEESQLVSISATPNFLYGDISGVVSDPNGAPLDSALVSASGVSDVTGSDGSYLLRNLNVGDHVVTVTRSNFATETASVNVQAQAEPTTQDFTLSPDMPSPIALVAIPGNEQVHLSWNQPGSIAEYDIAYYDDIFENQIGCNGGGCPFAVRLTPASYPTTLQHVVISIQPGGTATTASMQAYLDPSGSANGPSGQAIDLISSIDLSTDPLSDDVTQFLVDVSDLGVVVESGDIYIVINEPIGQYLSLANDTEPFSQDNLNRNWIFTEDYYTGVGDWSTIAEVLAGSPYYDQLTGDFGILGSFLGAPPTNASFAVSTLPSNNHNSSVVSFRNITNHNINFNQDENDQSIYQLETFYVTNPIPSAFGLSRDGHPELYKIYLVDQDQTSLFVSSTTDTFSIISVSSNYQNYCYNVKAVYDTGDPADGGYGIVESKPSNSACAIPFEVGDANFDSETTIEDVLTIVDFILEESTPSSLAFNNSDINLDGELNIADIVMIVDIISGSSVGRYNEIATSASVELQPNYSSSELYLKLLYSGGLKGLEFEIEFDPDIISLSDPSLVVSQDNVVTTFRKIRNGLIRVISFDVDGEFIIVEENKDFLKIPFKFNGDISEESNISLINMIVAGPKGTIADVSSNVVSTPIRLVPGAFALHQNYPNPFNPHTEISFDIPEMTDINVSVFNLMGQKVKTLVNDNITPGYHTIMWDGTNDKGLQVSTGMYFYTLQSSEKRVMRKMLFLK